MATEPPTELTQFQQFVTRQIEKGHTSLTPEECLELWRIEHPSQQLAEDDLKAIKAAIIDLNNGDRGIPAEEFVNSLRAKHNLPAE